MNFQKLISFIPVSPIVSFFGIGSITTIRILWVGLASLFLQLLILAFAGAFKVNAIYWGVPLLVSATILFIIGVIACTIYSGQRQFLPDNIVIDNITGMILTIGLSLPALIAAFNSVKSIMLTVCTSFLICDEWLQTLVAFIVTAPIPYAVYFTFHYWHLWPESWIEKHFKNGLGIMLGDIVISLYSTLVIYLMLFIPFKLNPVTTAQYFDYTIKTTIIFLLEMIGVVAGKADEISLSLIP